MQKTRETTKPHTNSQKYAKIKSNNRNSQKLYQQ